ncbi:MAG: hypothetical protein WC730_01310 [Patescibacteria group bacterium]|jgi:hypothetical protein
MLDTFKASVRYAVACLENIQKDDAPFFSVGIVFKELATSLLIEVEIPPKDVSDFFEPLRVELAAFCKKAVGADEVLEGVQSVETMLAHHRMLIASLPRRPTMGDIEKMKKEQTDVLSDFPIPEAVAVIATSLLKISREFERHIQALADELGIWTAPKGTWSRAETVLDDFSNLEFIDPDADPTDGAVIEIDEEAPIFILDEDTGDARLLPAVIGSTKKMMPDLGQFYRAPGPRPVMVEWEEDQLPVLAEQRTPAPQHAPRVPRPIVIDIDPNDVVTVRPAPERNASDGDVWEDEELLAWSTTPAQERRYAPPPATPREARPRQPSLVKRIATWGAVAMGFEFIVGVTLTVLVLVLVGQLDGLILVDAPQEKLVMVEAKPDPALLTALEEEESPPPNEPWTWPKVEMPRISIPNLPKAPAITWPKAPTISLPAMPTWRPSMPDVAIPEVGWPKLPEWKSEPAITTVAEVSAAETPAPEIFHTYIAYRNDSGVVVGCGKIDGVRYRIEVAGATVSDRTILVDGSPLLEDCVPRPGHTPSGGCPAVRVTKSNY